jgi:hypothetical protein
MRRVITVAAAAVALLGSLSIVAAAPTARASATRHVPTRHVVALEPNYRTGRVDWMTRASRFNIDEGPAAWATRLHWSRWNNQSATGSGTLWASDISGTERLGHVTIHLYRPREGVIAGGRKHPYFTRLHIIGGHGIVHYWHWSWSAKCWQ